MRAKVTLLACSFLVVGLQGQTNLELKLAQRQRDAAAAIQEMRSQAGQGNHISSTTPLVSAEDMVSATGASLTAANQQAAAQAELATMTPEARAAIQANAAQGSGGQVVPDMQQLLDKHVATSQQMTAGNYDAAAGQQAYNLDTTNRDLFLASPDGSALRTKLPAPDPRESWWNDHKEGHFVFDTKVAVFGLVEKLRHGGALGLDGKFEKFWMPMPIRLRGDNVHLLNLQTQVMVGSNSRVTMLINLYPHQDDKGSRIEIFYNTRWVAYRRGFSIWWHEVSWPWVQSFAAALLTQLGSADSVEALRSQLSSVQGRIETLQLDIIAAQNILAQTAQEVADAQAATQAATAALATVQSQLDAATTAQSNAQAAVTQAQWNYNAANGAVYQAQGAVSTATAAYNALVASGTALPAALLAAQSAVTQAQNSLRNAQWGAGPSWQNLNQAQANLSQAAAVVATNQQVVDVAKAQLLAFANTLEATVAMDSQTRFQGATYATNDSEQPAVQVDALQTRITNNQSSLTALQAQAVDLQSRLDALGDPASETPVAVTQAGTGYIAGRSSDDPNAELYRAPLGASQQAQNTVPTTTAGSTSAVAGIVLANGGTAENAAAAQSAVNAQAGIASYTYTNTDANLDVGTAVQRQTSTVNKNVFSTMGALPPLGGGTGQDSKGGDPNPVVQPPTGP